ncbi:hypothetical protein CYMTET_38407 [Cymbomonas tetramitiformis]|uniref:Uncharacterized protein n=1 Tax=Cymbomonas tetramitiformis TaxID=36881 RepID=A0AAE0CDU5_9CHLO|nr:hypothetical protein CYMTET_38407 [Cymbomonas tetramitiformis]
MMRKLWLLLNFHDVKLQAKYIRSKANEWADRVSSCSGLRSGIQSCCTFPVSVYVSEERRRSSSTTRAEQILAGIRLKTYWEQEDAYYTGVVHHYEDEELVDLVEETCSVITTVETPFGEKSLQVVGETSDSPGNLLTDTVQWYTPCIDPTAAPDQFLKPFFGWMAP